MLGEAVREKMSEREENERKLREKLEIGLESRKFSLSRALVSRRLRCLGIIFPPKVYLVSQLGFWFS